MATKKIDEKILRAALTRIEKEHPFRVTARCDDGSAFFVPTMGGECFRLTAAKILKLAAIGPAPK